MGARGVRGSSRLTACQSHVALPYVVAAIAGGCEAEYAASRGYLEASSTRLAPVDAEAETLVRLSAGGVLLPLR